MSARRTLPHRRPALTLPVVWGAHRFAITVGFDLETGAIAEVFFADGQKSGTDLQHTIQDACVVVSLALQYGTPAAQLGHSLGRVPDLAGGVAPASPIGAIVDAIAEAIA